jgi:hypothetical protein
LTDAFVDVFAGKYELVINIPMRNKVRRPIGTITSGFLLRRVSIDRGGMDYLLSRMITSLIYLM